MTLTKFVEAASGRCVLRTGAVAKREGITTKKASPKCIEKESRAAPARIQIPSKHTNHDNSYEFMGMDVLPFRAVSLVHINSQHLGVDLPKRWKVYKRQVKTKVLNPIYTPDARIKEIPGYDYVTCYDHMTTESEDELILRELLEEVGGCSIPFTLVVTPSTTMWNQRQWKSGDPNDALKNCLRRNGIALVQLLVVAHAGQQDHHSSMLIFDAAAKTITRMDPNGTEHESDIDAVLEERLAPYLYTYKLAEPCPIGFNTVSVGKMTNGLCAAWVIMLDFIIFSNRKYSATSIIRLLEDTHHKC